MSVIKCVSSTPVSLAGALSILTSRSEANKHRARNAGADVSVLSTLKFPGQTESPGGSPEKVVKIGPQPAGVRPNYQGARQPLTQVPGGAPRVVNGPGKFPGGRMMSGFGGVGQNQAPRGGPQSVRQVGVGGGYFGPGTFPGQMAGGRGPIVHHIRVPQPRAPQYYRPAYTVAPATKAVPQRPPGVFPPSAIHPRAPLQRPVGVPGQSYGAPPQQNVVRRFAPGAKMANGPGRPPAAEMGTQAQPSPLPNGQNPAGMVNHTQPLTAQVKVPVAEVGLQASAQIPPGAPTRATETGTQSPVSNRGTVNGPVTQSAATESRLKESGPKTTAEMGCQARPVPLQTRLVATELPDVSKVQAKIVADVQPKPSVASEAVPKTTPTVTDPPNPVVNKVPPVTNPTPDPNIQEISRAQPVPNTEENLAKQPGPTKASPDEAARAPATSADVDGAPRMTSAARAGSELSLQMLAEVTAAAEAERELERIKSEVKRGPGPASSGGTKRARAEVAAKPPLAEGASSGSGQQRIPTASDEIPRPPKKPRTGMHRTPSKLVAERFPSFAEEAREQQSQDSGGSPSLDEAEQKDTGNEIKAERGRRMRMRGPPQRLG